MDENIIFKHLISIILMLYGYSSLPRKIVQTDIDSWTDLIINTIFASLKADILEILKNDNIPAKKIDDCFNKYKSIFKRVDSEHKRFKILKQYGKLDFQEYVVDSLLEKKVANQTTELIVRNIYGIHVSLESTLKMNYVVCLKVL